VFKLGVVLDELSDDLESALRQAKEIGFDYVELYRFWGVETLNHDLETQKRAKGLLEQYGMPVRTLLTPTLKSLSISGMNPQTITKSEEFARHMETHRRGIAAARFFGAGLLRVFSCNNGRTWPLKDPLSAEELKTVAAGLRIACDMAAGEGAQLGLENVRSCFGNTGRNQAAIISAVGRENLGAIWDPANDNASGGVGYPDGYEAVKPFIRDVHFKDARIKDRKTGENEWACIGHGDLDALGQLRALMRDGYEGGVTVETHWKHPDGSNGTAETTANLRRLIEAARQNL